MSYRRRSSSSNHRFCVMWAFRLFPWGKARLLCRPTAADAKRHRLWSMNTTAMVYVFSVCRNKSTRVPLLHLNKTTSGKLLAEQLAVNCNSPRGRGSLLDQYVVYYHRRWHSPSLSIDVQSVPHLSWSLSPSVPSTGRWEEWALAVFPFNSFDWIPEKERRESGRDLVLGEHFNSLLDDAECLVRIVLPTDGVRRIKVGVSRWPNCTFFVARWQTSQSSWTLRQYARQANLYTDRNCYWSAELSRERDRLDRILFFDCQFSFIIFCLPKFSYSLLLAIDRRVGRNSRSTTYKAGQTGRTCRRLHDDIVLPTPILWVQSSLVSFTLLFSFLCAAQRPRDNSLVSATSYSNTKHVSYFYMPHLFSLLSRSIECKRLFLWAVLFFPAV